MYRWQHKKRLRFLAMLLGEKRPMQIVDVGANPAGGRAIYEDLLEEEVAQLLGFEPNEEAFAKLAPGMSAARRFLPYAIGKPGPATFFAHSLSDLSSTYPFRKSAADFLGKRHWYTREITPIAVDLVALDDLADVPPIDVLKLDVQGAELDVIHHGARKLSRAAVVIPEVAFYQIYDGQPMLRDIDEELHKQGFVLHRILFQKAALLPSSQQRRLHRRARSQSIDGDAVYIRNLERPDDVPTETLKNLALAADSIFASYDLCLMCLDLLAARGEVQKNAPARYLRHLPEDMVIDDAREASDGSADHVSDELNG